MFVIPVINREPQWNCSFSNDDSQADLFIVVLAAVNAVTAVIIVINRLPMLSKMILYFKYTKILKLNSTPLTRAKLALHTTLLPFWNQDHSGIEKLTPSSGASKSNTGICVWVRKELLKIQILK